MDKITDRFSFVTFLRVVKILVTASNCQAELRPSRAFFNAKLSDFSL